MPLTFEILCKCVSVHSTNAYYELSDSHRYFHLVAIFVLSHLWSLMHACLKDMLSGISHLIP